MKIGILETDILHDDVQQKYGSYSEMFQKLLSAVDYGLEFKTYNVVNSEYPLSVDECDAYLITGSQSSAYDKDAWILKLKKYIVELVSHKQKLIGICFGHQIIAHALNGLTEKNNNGWSVGLVSSQVVRKMAWMTPNKKKFSLRVSHQDQVVRLPDDADLIASNAFCLNAGFQIDNHVLTFQGHPEFSNEYLEYLMDKRRDILGEGVVMRAKESLQNDADDSLIATWIVNFLGHR